MCARYPMCSSSWSNYDIHFEKNAPKKERNIKCTKHKTYKGVILPKTGCYSCMEVYAEENKIPYEKVKELCQIEESKKYEKCFHCKQIFGENCSFCAVRKTANNFS